MSAPAQSCATLHNTKAYGRGGSWTGLRVSLVGNVSVSSRTLLGCTQVYCIYFGFLNQYTTGKGTIPKEATHSAELLEL